MTRYQLVPSFSWLLLLAVTVQGFGPEYYVCDPTKCQGDCHCPSLASPGGQVLQSIPQFVLITHDDAISPLANTVVRSVTDGFKNPDGCNVVATWFTTSTGSDCSLAKSLYDENHEIALHTVHHKSLLPGLPDMENEIMGARQDMAACGIPKEEMVGFRSPYLIHNPSVRGILHKHDFLYDSSIIDFIGSQSTTTKIFGNRLWPYTMDSGIIQNCAWTAPSGSCTEDEAYPGMWEVPLWPLLNDTIDKPNNAYSMDPGPGFGGDVYTTLVTNFDEAYNGNRAPFPLFTHAQWFTDENIAATRKFIEYALSKGDVYFVTMKDLINWMQNPISASDYRKVADCKPVDVQPPVKKLCQVYIVQPGDYLESIAGKFGVLNVNELTMINPTLQTQTLQPGDRVNIPPWDDTCPPSSEIEAINTSVKETSIDIAPASTAIGDQNISDTLAIGAGMAESIDPPASMDDGMTSLDQAPIDYPEADGESHLCQLWTIDSEEDIQGVSKVTGASVESIKVLNGLVGESLVVGQILKIPPYPSCCDTNTCEYSSSQQTPPETRVDISMNLVGNKGVDGKVLEQIKSVVATELNIPVEAITAQTFSRRRGRRLREVGDVNSTNLLISIATSTPRRLHGKVSEELRSGDIESILSGLGYTMASMPVVKAYEGGLEVFPNEQTDINNENSSSTFWTTGVIIGVAVGGSVALLVSVGLVVYCLLRIKRKSVITRTPVTQNPASGIPVAEVSLRSSHTKKSDPCEIVVSTGFDTPTTPNHRTAFR